MLFSSQESLFRLRADSFARGANLKLRQANARAQAKVAQARARVCQGLATPVALSTGVLAHTHVVYSRLGELVANCNIAGITQDETNHSRFCILPRLQGPLKCK